MSSNKGIMRKFGAKYGVTLRKRYLEIFTKLKRKYICPNCGSSRLKRKAFGIWNCEKCGFKIAGKAYSLQ